MSFTSKKTGTLTGEVLVADGPNGQLTSRVDRNVTVEAAGAGLKNNGKIKFIFDNQTLRDMLAFGGEITFDATDIAAAAQELVINDRSRMADSFYNR